MANNAWLLVIITIPCGCSPAGSSEYIVSREITLLHVQESLSTIAFVSLVCLDWQTYLSLRHLHSLHQDWLTHSSNKSNPTKCSSEWGPPVVQVRAGNSTGPASILVIYIQITDSCDKWLQRLNGLGYNLGAHNISVQEMQSSCLVVTPTGLLLV